jgi:hypothetical protein
MDTLRKQLTARLEELSAKEDRLLDLIGDPGWPHNKIKQKLAVIDRERNEILSKLADTTGKIDVGRRYFLTALDLLRDPSASTPKQAPNLRRGLYEVIFDKLYVDDGHVTAHTLNSGLDELVEAGQPTSRRYMRRAPHTHACGWAQHEASPVLMDEAGDDSTGAGRLDMILSGHGSNKTALVEVLCRHSNSQDLIMIMNDVLDKIKTSDQTIIPGVSSTGGLGSVGARKLSEADRMEMVERFRRGTKILELASQFHVSKGCVQRTLGRSGVGRHDRY